MSRFNLIDEKWIPVRFPDGSRDELGIRDTLLRAREIAAIEDPSPLVVAALHRFLLAVLYRALEGPTDIDQARALFREGLPGAKITAYLEKWRDRFWLFDERYPFGQNPNVPKSNIEPWTKLTAEYNATTNRVLFDHTNTKHPGERLPNECARWIISTMTFSISGGRGYYPSPSPNAVMCIPMGEHLQQTLCYSLAPYPNRNVMRGDSALWEREPETLPIGTPKRSAYGYADLYTWQPRMILLSELPSGGVMEMRFSAGKGFENPTTTPDPMQPHTISQKEGLAPVRFEDGKATWRDFDSLLPDANGRAPGAIQNAISVARHNATEMPKSILVIGLRYTPPNANVEFWRMERFALPQALAGDRSVRTEIQALLTEAKVAHDSFEKSLRGIAKSILAKGDRDLEPDKWVKGKWVPGDVSKFIGKTSVEAIPNASANYWSTLEARFHEVLREFTLERDPDDIRLAWLIAVRDALREAWRRHAASVSGGDGWAIRALVKAEGPVEDKLKQLNAEIARHQPPEEKA